MMNTATKLKTVLAAVAGVLTGLWGWMGWLVVIWVVCMVLDYISGSAAAGAKGQWSSGKARAGIWHKAGMILVVAVSALADLLVSIVLENLPLIDLPIQYSGLICPIVLVWYIVTELGSIAENAVEMGAEVPGWLVKLLAAGKQAADAAGAALEAAEPTAHTDGKDGDDG